MENKVVILGEHNIHDYMSKEIMRKMSNTIERDLRASERLIPNTQRESVAIYENITFPTGETYNMFVKAHLIIEENTDFFVGVKDIILFTGDIPDQVANELIEADRAEDSVRLTDKDIKDFGEK